jgi:glyoxylase-like metal-dependent hydrolase (beta-lactamase superfamily II)
MADEDLGHGIRAIDTGYFRPCFDASYLVVENGRAAFVDVGTTLSAPRLMASLEEAGLLPDSVDYVILTHVHLDHAGGAGEMMRRLPRARLVVHPRGARHMADPSRLWQGALAVYGEQAMRRNYGALLPVPEERIVAAGEGFTLDLAARELRFVDTPGHARHHVCIWDEASRGLFTGDTFGLAYPELASERGPLLLPTTTPVQFEPEPLKASIERLMGFAPRCAYLTHYSRLADPSSHARTLCARVDELAALARSARGRAERGGWLRGALMDLLAGWAREHGTPLAPERLREVLAVDVELNAQGLEVWLERAGS